MTFQGRFEPLATELKGMLNGGRFGRLLWASSNTVWYRDAAYYRSKPWRGTWAEEGGGVLINQAIHAIDLFVRCAGLPSRLTAQTRTLNHEIEVEDGAVAMLDYAGGAHGADPGDDGCLSRLRRAAGVLRHARQRGLSQGRRAPGMALHRSQGGWREAHRSHSGAASPMDLSAVAHADLFGDFAAALRTGGRPLIDGREGRRSLEVVEAIYRSSRTRRRGLPLT